MAGRPPAEPPDRDFVLDWMRVNDKGASEAARHFKLSPNTVRSWANRAKKSPAKGSQRNGRNADADGQEEGSGADQRSPQSNGRTVLDPDDLDGEAAPLLRRAAMRFLRYMAGELADDDAPLDGALLDLSPELQKRIRKALGANLWDPRGAKDAALGLAILVDKCPGILGLGQRIEAGESGVAASGAVGGGDAVERLQRVLREE